MSEQNPKMKYLPHKLLHNGHVYIAIQGTNEVIKISLTVLKVMQVPNPDGSMKLNADGTKTYNLNTQIGMVVLTNEEWLTEKETGLA